MSLTTTTEPYVPGTIQFSQYLEQLEFLFEHNNYSADKYKIFFLAVCGTEIYNQVKLLFPGQNVRDLSYKQITDELKKRYDKKDSDVIHTYKFWTRRQGQHEKSEDFVLAVKQLAELCDFGDFKDRAIRDALVIGTYDRQLQKRLFDEDILTAAKAEKLIVSQELSSDRTRFVNRDEEKRVSIVARKCSIEESHKKLYVIDGNRLSILGKIRVSVRLNGFIRELYMVVLQVDKDFVPLMGRSWLDIFYSGWRNTFVRPLMLDQRVNAMTDDDVREEAVVEIENDTPVFKKAYEVPLRLRDKVVEHLDALEKDGVITPIEASEWASPVVVVIKKDQGIRLVIDCKVSINKLIIPNKYPLPLPQDLFAALSGSKLFALWILLVLILSFCFQSDPKGLW
ncbi:uncharacterized protein LOC129774585 [Toxorhynchites rutilus septentrionalis]|uniref:uncharacterized protein LOC129774585 n=1 Tax=Toxorhynchites rutilus septentrionalis TaxID=329112 RepID=UPI0024788089|nr:uncharacterized protein LOC129774585 [Toxorhynchites rutilus septentrionalis]